jgi:hypothetical protein
MAAHAFPDLTTYQVLHLGVVPVPVGAGGRGYEVPSMTVVVELGGDVVVVVVGGVVAAVELVVVVGGLDVVGCPGSPFASTQYDSPLILKFPHVDVIDGFYYAGCQLVPARYKVARGSATQKRHTQRMKSVIERPHASTMFWQV